MAKMKLSLVVNLIYVAGFLDLLAVSMTIPMLSKHARDLGASPTAAGLLSSVYGLLQLISSPLVGRWSDISGRKYVLIWCLMLSAVGYVLLGMSTTIFFLLLARIPAGLFKHSQELSKAYLADLTPVDEHAKVFGQFNSVSSIGFVFGPIIGGHLADSRNGFYWVSIFTAAIFLLDTFLVLLVLPRDGVSTTKDNSRANTSFESFNLHAFLRSFYEVDWKNVWEITGYMISYSGVVGTVSGFFVGRIASKYNDDTRLLLHTGIVQMLTMCAMTFAPNVPVLALLMTPLSISNAIARVCAINLTLARGSDTQKGMLLGLGASVLSLSRMISPAIGGLSHELSASGPSIVGTLVSAAGILVLLLAPYDRPSVSKKDN